MKQMYLNRQFGYFLTAAPEHIHHTVAITHRDIIIIVIKTLIVNIYNLCVAFFFIDKRYTNHLSKKKR